ncbi:hypothetical protein [Alteribacter natronophilus]|uniref:hypothetical protein n=1 Tax=Alteribacter natronophilus TaxID=2583810 RepID=UPI00110D49D4|nr:hypothetical protein [Alteribacter natronophilus]TMW70444.1 hypothetical protein FGB90_17415 [Alteribacter natronophilus]
MFKLKNVTKEEKNEQVTAVIIFLIAIGIGLAAAFTSVHPNHFSAGYMAGSLLSCLVIYSLYLWISGLLNKNKSAEQ